MMSDWNGIIDAGDAESIWNALYSLVRDRDIVQICSSRLTNESLDEIYSEIAQEVFLRLMITDRLTYFVANGFTSEQIESNLLLNDLAQVLSSRKEYPASEAPDEVEQRSEFCRQAVTFKTSHATKPV
jgi:hypothetical protein